MYHSIDFISESEVTANTYDHWHLVPSTRPTISMPPVKTSYIEIPGASGKLDLSETLTKYPIYDNRTGSIDFIVLNNYQTNNHSWLKLYEEIARFLHGKKLKMILEDDKYDYYHYYYEGRFDIAWNSDNSGQWSTVTINYEVDPYKYDSQIQSLYKSGEHGSAAWNNTNHVMYVDVMPTIPTFEIANIGSSGISIDFVNEELGIDTKKEIEDNGTYTFYDLILSNIHGNNIIDIKVVGNGTVTMNWRNGRL